MASHLKSYFLKLSIINFNSSTYFYMINIYILITSKLSKIDNTVKNILMIFPFVKSNLDS